MRTLKPASNKHTPELIPVCLLSNFMMWSWIQLRIWWYEWCHSVRFGDVMSPTVKDLYMRTSSRWHLGPEEEPQESTRVRKVDIMRTQKYFRNITRWKRSEKQGYGLYLIYWRFDHTSKRKLQNKKYIGRKTLLWAFTIKKSYWTNLSKLFVIILRVSNVNERPFIPSPFQFRLWIKLRRLLKKLKHTKKW